MDSFFKLGERNSSVSTELRAGLTTVSRYGVHHRRESADSRGGWRSRFRRRHRYLHRRGYHDYRYGHLL